MLHFCHIYSIENSFLSALGPELYFFSLGKLCSRAGQLCAIQVVGAKKNPIQKNAISPLDAASRKKSIGASLIAYFQMFIYEGPFVDVKMYTDKKYFH